MKVFICQSNIAWADPAGNRRHFEEMLQSQPETKGNLFVLPEMFSTGFVTEPVGIAEKDGGTLQWMRDMAGRYGCAIAGSVAVEEDGKFFNRFFFVKPDGSFAQYDKHHLFTYGGEDKRFTPGRERTIVEYMGVRFLLQVCYDLRFPAYSRNSLKDTFDAAIYVASWPVPRIGAWDILLKARAIENQCFVIGVNRVGDDPSCSYNGHSVIIDPYGSVIASCPEGVESVNSAVLDIDGLKAFRSKFPVLNDADTSPLIK